MPVYPIPVCFLDSLMHEQPRRHRVECVDFESADVIESFAIQFSGPEYDLPVCRFRLPVHRVRFVHIHRSPASSDSFACKIDFAQSNKNRYGHGNARHEVPLVASSNGSPDRFAICHALASAALSFASDGTTGLAFLFEGCLFSTGCRLLVNEKQTTFKEEKTLWPINQYSHAA